jgi:hypothetical protein
VILAGGSVERRKPVLLRGLHRLIGIVARLQQDFGAGVQTTAKTWQTHETRMGHRHQGRQIEGAARIIDPCPAAAYGAAQLGFVTNRAGKVIVIARKTGVLLKHACGHCGPCATVATGNVARVNEPQPIEDPLSPSAEYALRACTKPLKSAQDTKPYSRATQDCASCKRRPSALSASSSLRAAAGERVAKPGEGIDIAAAIGSKQVLRQFLQMVEIWPIGEPSPQRNAPGGSERHHPPGANRS